MITEDLKPCPFCGNPAELRVSSHVPRSFGCRVMCEPCGVGFTRTGSDIDSASIKAKCIAAWNRRAPHRAEPTTPGSADR